MDATLLQRRLERANAEIAGLERLIETKMRDLYLSQESLRRSAAFTEKVLKHMSNALVVLDAYGAIAQANDAATRMLGGGESILGRSLGEFVEGGRDRDPSDFVLSGDELVLRLPAGGSVPTHFSGSRLVGGDGELEGYVCVWADVSEKKALEVELRHMQKMESLGQMAAGVAHEINTPIQFVGDSLQFLETAFEDMGGVLRLYRAWARHHDDPARSHELQGEVRTAEEEADLDFVEGEAPGAFRRATTGLERVAKIVRALKNFSHPGVDSAVPVQVNEVIETAVTLAQNEIKYVADLELDLDDVPQVPCYQGDLGQALLNLVVNAAHAIAEKVGESGERGLIRVVTRCEERDVTITISDTGCGIPADLRERIFDPFFTTKEVGRGTGQGLAITRKLVVGRLGGRIDVESEVGVGSTFVLSLPRLRAEEAA